MRSPARRRSAALVAAAVLVASQVACGGEAPAPPPSPPPPRVAVALVTHQAPGDTFWDLVRRGAQAAADKDGIDLRYLHDPDPMNQARQVDGAARQGAAGIAVTLADPAVLAPVVRRVVDAGIPVIAVNTGIDAWREVGAVAYFGQDDLVAGREVGKRLQHEGAREVLCVLQARGHVGLEARCDGAAQTFPGPVRKLYVDGTRPPAVKADLVGALQRTRSIDRVLTLGAPVALTALQAVGEANSYAKVVTFDTNRGVLDAVELGLIGWAVDQQPFLQGYLAVNALWLYLTNGNVIGGGLPTLTGPSFVDESNVAAVAQRAQAGTR
ncbi:sugar ABC transporter substrate-binding protein [Mycobacterium sp. djl-10]|nr:sugar ABC transporter substrate-binding protein [Mycobacterium sp. djl-10]